MDDLISRQAAIDAINVLCQEHRYKIPGKAETYSQYNEAWQDALDRAEGAIFNLPPAEPHWIPVTERLPETTDAVLTTYIVNGDRSRRYVEESSYYGNDESWSSPWDEYREAGTSIEVIAWMPMPATWKGE